MLPTISKRSYSPLYMPGFFDDDFLPLFKNRSNSMPAVNIREDEKRYSLDLAVPGMEKKDLKSISKRIYLQYPLKPGMNRKKTVTVTRGKSSAIHRSAGIFRYLKM